MATQSYDSLINAISDTIEERLSGGVASSLPALDDLFKSLFTTSMGVSTDSLGRDFKAIHILREGVSGALKWTTATGTQPTGYSSNYSQHTVMSYQADAFPGLEDQAGPGHIRQTVSLARMMGNVLVPHEYIRAAKLQAAIADGLAEIIRGASENIALAEIQAWYALDNTGAIAVIQSDTPQNNEATGDRSVLVVGSGSIRNFHSGMHVDVVNGSTGAVRFTDVVVDAVRYVPDDTNDSGGYGEVTLQSVAASPEDLTAIAANDLIVRRDSTYDGGAASVSYGPMGPEQWLVDIGATTDPFGIEVDVFEQFASVVKAVSGVLTEQVLNRYFGRYFQAYGMQNMPDTIITSMGVTNAHVENSDGLGRFDRTGKAFVIANGFDYGAVPFTFNGMNMKWHVSAFMPSASDVTSSSPTGGRLWALKLRDQNIMRYVPPKLAGSKAGTAPMDSEVEFAFPLGGPNGIFKPYHNSSGNSTNWQEAPFYKHVAYAPRFMPGIKLTSLSENL